MNSQKRIKIFFTDFWPDFVPENTLSYRILKRYYNIVITDDDPDIIFFSVFGDDNKNFGGKHVLITGELLDLSRYDYDYCIGHQYELIGRNNCLRWNMFAPRFPYLNLVKVKKRIMAKPELAQRKFCNFIYSNGSNGSGALLRQEFCKKLSKYKRVDCPGRILNNMDPSYITARHVGDWQKGKLEFIRNYKFTIAFENESIPGYTTEKLWHPLRAGSIPIYWGNPSICDEVSSKAIINCHDYDCDFDAVIERVIEVDNDPDLYIHMLNCMPLKRGYRYGYGDLRRFLYKLGQDILIK